MSEYDPPTTALRSLVALALAEDFGVQGDITSIACIDAHDSGRASLVVRESGVLAGTAAATEVFRQVDPSVEVDWLQDDGDAVEAGDTIANVKGATRSLLLGERVALNLLSHCSGIATLTRRCVVAAGDTLRVRDTRKTMPGLRALQRAAVRAGGGFNHRDSLSDAVLIKDNHLTEMGIREAVARARARWPGRIVEVECDTLEQVREAGDAGVDIVMVDNMAPAEVQEAVQILGDAVPVEISGGITLDSIPAFARTGAAYVSIGALTHSVRALDIGLDMA
jgi:nicotinate-nucleotide pyrophosphorylase (carboxylating)